MPEDAELVRDGERADVGDARLLVPGDCRLGERPDRQGRPERREQPLLEDRRVVPEGPLPFVRLVPKVGLGQRPERRVGRTVVPASGGLLPTRHERPERVVPRALGS